MSERRVESMKVSEQKPGWAIAGLYQLAAIRVFGFALAFPFFNSVDQQLFFFSSRRRHTRLQGDWSSDVCSSDLEIGPLRTVLVHTPGRELVAVTPGNREDYLYDDIIDLDLAQREHRRFVAVLERFAEVYEVRDLLTELAARPEVREFLVTRALEVVPSDALAKQLGELSPEDFVSLMIEGAMEEAGPIARALNEVGYALPPLPNLFFTRDVGIVIGEHSIIGSMRHGVRWTEGLLIKALV